MADLRLLLVSPSLDERGAERIVVELAAHARRLAHPVTVAAPPGSFDRDLGDIGVQRLPLEERRRSTPGAALTSLALARGLGDVRPTVIHAHNPKMTVVAHVARRLARCPARLVATFHGGDRREDHRAARLLRLADQVVCVDDELSARMAGTGVPDRKVSVIRNGTSPAADLGPDDRRRLCDELDLTGPVVASVGELVTSKAVDRFLHAAAHIATGHPDATFLVVGDGPLRGDLERLAASLGLSQRVRFAGRRRDARALIAVSTVVVSTSRSEGLSLVALETLAAGVPLIAPDVGGMRGLLAMGAGMLVPDTEPGTVGDAVAGILRSPDRAEAMGIAGRAVAAEHDLDRMLRSYAGLYAELSG